MNKFNPYLSCYDSWNLSTPMLSYPWSPPQLSWEWSNLSFGGWSKLCSWVKPWAGDLHFFQCRLESDSKNLVSIKSVTKHIQRTKVEMHPFTLKWLMFPILCPESCIMDQSTINSRFDCKGCTDVYQLLWHYGVMCGCTNMFDILGTSLDIVTCDG